MDAYMQSKMVATSVAQQTSNQNNGTPQTKKIIAIFPATNKEFDVTELHTPDGTYPLLHKTLVDFIAPDFWLGTRVSMFNFRDDYPSYNTAESSEDEGLYMGNNGGFGSASFSMTPVKSAALPIPNKSSSAKSTIRTTAASSIGNSIKNGNGLQILTSPQKSMTTTASGNNSSPYFPSSPMDPSTPTQQQFASGSYMMSSSHDLQQQQSDYGFPSSYNNNSGVAGSVAGSMTSLSSFLGRSNNPTSSRSTSQLSSSFARSSSVNNKPKNYLQRHTSAFVNRFLVHERQQQLLRGLKELGTDSMFLNIGTSFIWLDPLNPNPKEILSRIVVNESKPSCHDINETTRCDDHIDVIIGFITGDILWFEPISGRFERMNKGGSMVKSEVVMIKWIPDQDKQFIAVFKNGTVMTMEKGRDDQGFNIPEPTTDTEAEFIALKPHSRAKYNPVSCWKMSDQAITDLAFSSDKAHVAITGADGKLRIIDYHTNRLTDVFSGYFGKLTCVDWSPDGNYILTGGEDDLVTIWSYREKRMIARCEGHEAFVTGVAFDRWRCDDQTYRFGSVGEDCNLILWDFSLAALQNPKHSRLIATSPPLMAHEPGFNNIAANSPYAPMKPMERKKSSRSNRMPRGFSTPDSPSSNMSPSNTSKSFSSFTFLNKRSSQSSNTSYADEMVSTQLKQFLPVIHPPLKMSQAAILLPTTTQEVHPDPCVSVTFRENSIVTTDRRGRIFTWGRP